MIEWVVKSFNNLSREELYSIFRLRNEVFIVEQKILYSDADCKDQICHHLLGWEDESLVAYCRILPKGVYFDEPSIGRAMEESGKLFGVQRLKIEAQAYLLKFYGSIGFVQVSEIYNDHDVPHIDMTYTPPESN